MKPSKYRSSMLLLHTNEFCLLIIMAVLEIKTGNIGSLRERAMKDLDGYVACIKSFRNKLCLCAEE